MVLSGELIYILPYFLPRVFRPTYLDVFHVNNFELGSAFSVYGTVALFSYLFGGPIADKFAPRKLISLSLILTSLGGIVLATYPSYNILKLLYGYWGFTTVFLFWGPMIKATRIWGGSKSQGKAFGYLDGGRGLVAAIMGSIGVFIFSFILTDNIKSSSLLERQDAFKYVILFSSLVVALAGVIIYFTMKKNDSYKEITSSKSSFKNIISVLKLEPVWLLMIIIMCAYFGYKTVDIYPLYASEIMGYDQIQSANIGSFQLYLRFIVCFLVGFLADKSSAIKWIIIGFIVLLIGSLIFTSGFIKSGLDVFFISSLIIIGIGTYAVRALYFAVLEEGEIPITLTGTAVGLISITGYTPDIFSGPLMGYLLDNNPGITGHQYVFLILVGFSVLGLLSSIRFAVITKRKSTL